MGVNLIDPWYEKYHRHNETEQFKSWWHNEYGPIQDYMESEVDTYFTRRAFALMGWLAAKANSGLEDELKLQGIEKEPTKGE